MKSSRFVDFNGFIFYTVWQILKSDPKSVSFKSKIYMYIFQNYVLRIEKRSCKINSFVFACARAYVCACVSVSIAWARAYYGAFIKNINYFLKPFIFIIFRLFFLNSHVQCSEILQVKRQRVYFIDIMSESKKELIQSFIYN